MPNDTFDVGFEILGQTIAFVFLIATLPIWAPILLIVGTVGLIAKALGYKPEPPYGLTGGKF